MEINFNVSDFANHVPKLGINKIFSFAQRDKKSHAKLNKQLFILYKENSNEDFIIEYLQCLTVLFCNDKSPALERCLEFAANYCVFHNKQIDDDQDMFLYTIYLFLFKNHMREMQVIRFRVCEFINTLLTLMGEQAMIDDDIFSSLAHAMLARLQDRLPSIRAQAVLSLRRLQDPHNPSCPIIKALLFHLENDPSNEVRAKVVCHIAVTHKTLPAILGRIYDKKDVVRKETYRTISRLKLLRLSLKQRQDVLTVAIRDRSRLVNEYVEQHLVPAWFKQCDLNYVELLKLLDVQTLEDAVEDLLFCLFKKEPLSNLIEMVKSIQVAETKLIPLDSLIPESAVLWRCLVKFITSNEGKDNNEADLIDDDNLSQILPELTPFTRYINQFCSTLSSGHAKEKEFVLNQLLKIAVTYSFSDEMGREQLRKSCMHMLTNEAVNVGSVGDIAKIMEGVVPYVKDRLIMMAEVISDIREPLSTQPPINEVGDVQLPTIEQCVEDVQLHLADLRCTQELDDLEREMRTDTHTLLKCLTIVKHFLKARDVIKIDSTLLSLNEHFITTCLQPSNKPEVICLALDVLALMAIRNLDLAKKNFLMICFQVEENSLSLSALKTMFDLLCVHGFQNMLADFQEPETDSEEMLEEDDKWPSNEDFKRDETIAPNTRKLIAFLTYLLQSSSAGVKAVTCQGLCKLLLCGEISSPIVFAQLVLLWYNPDTDGVTLIRQPLGVFFSSFCKIRADGPAIIVDAVLPVLRALCSSGLDDPLTTVNINVVFNVLLDFIRHDVLPPSSNLSESGASYHLLLGEKVCKDLLRTRGEMGNLLTKLLGRLQLIPEDSEHADRFLLLLGKIIDMSSKAMDKASLKLISFLKDKVQLLIQNITKPSKDKVVETDNCSTSQTGAIEKTTAEPVTMITEDLEEDCAESRMIPGTPSSGSTSRSVENTRGSTPIVPASPSSGSCLSSPELPAEPVVSPHSVIPESSCSSPSEFERTLETPVKRSTRLKRKAETHF